MELPQLDLAKFTDGYFKAAEDKKAKKKGEDDFFKVCVCRGGVHVVWVWVRESERERVSACE